MTAVADKITCLAQVERMRKAGLLTPGSRFQQELNTASVTSDYAVVIKMLDDIRNGRAIDRLLGRANDKAFQNSLIFYGVFNAAKPAVKKVRRWSIMTALLCVIVLAATGVFFWKLAVIFSKSMAGIADTNGIAAEIVQYFSFEYSWNSLWAPPLCALEMEIKSQMTVLAADYRASKKSVEDTISEGAKGLDAEKLRISSEVKSVLDAFINSSAADLERISNLHAVEVEKMRQAFSLEMESIKAEFDAILADLKEQLNNTVEALTLIQAAGEIQLTKQSQQVLETVRVMNITQANAQALGTTVVSLKQALVVETAKLNALHKGNQEAAAELAKQKARLNAYIADADARVKGLYRHVEHLITHDGSLTWTGYIVGIVLYVTYFYLLCHVAMQFLTANACANIGVIGVCIAFFVIAYLVDLFFGFVYGTVATSAKAVEETVNNIPHVFEQAIERAANNTYARVFGS